MCAACGIPFGTIYLPKWKGTGHGGKHYLYRNLLPDAGRIEAAPAVCFQCFYSVEYVLLRCDALPGSDHVVQQGRYRKVYHVAECITCVNFVLCTALQLLNIADLSRHCSCPIWWSQERSWQYLSPFAGMIFSFLILTWFYRKGRKINALLDLS